ncbi:VanZ family protein [Allomuricauda sp. M10]|uniref:VanZ family protein n=1 Tax=Allomuricauda sp. M10 TaxID=2683292 RepID=UPI001D193DA2|nr:VanZ family protein [Muricauda sp. M10]
MLSLFSFSTLHLNTGKIHIPYADKMTHFVFYTGFAFLGSLCLRERTQGNVPLGKATMITVVTAICYGILIELLQYLFTTDRMAEIGDVLANSLGALTGIGLIRWLFSKEKPLKWKF